LRIHGAAGGARPEDEASIDVAASTPGAGAAVPDEFFFRDQMSFRHSRLVTVYFSMKMAESREIVGLVTFFLKYSGQISKKNIVTLQKLRFQLKTIDQTCIWSKSIIQLANTISLDSAIFI
jgi:hypothetical protein